MGSSVAAKANHYDVLGLTPSASDSQIARAFADAMSMFRVRPIAALAEISAAYETLRNPAKRRDYDRSIGIAPPPPAPRQWAIAAPAVRWGTPALAPAPAPAQASAPPAEELHEAEPLSAIAASLREIARADPLGAPVHRKEPRPDAGEPAIPHFLAEPRLDTDDQAEERPFDWKRPALAVGGFLAAAGLIGTFAGLSVRDNAQPFGSGESITAALPSAKARVKAPAAFEPVAQASGAQAMLAQAAPPQQHRAASRHKAGGWVEHSVREAQAIESAPADAPPEQTAADPLAPAAADSGPQPVAASMPLPSGVVARTIERIGYSCGSIASTSAVDGSPGVFTVTCTSGQRYQASPVHGRYRFRRLGGR